MRRIVFFLLIFLFTSGGLFSHSLPAANNNAATAADQRRNQTFRAIYPKEPKTLDPHASPSDPAAIPVIMAAYERLIYFEHGSARPMVNRKVVQAYRISPDGKKYTFILHEGRTFSDGTPVTSEALLFSFDRLMSSPVGVELFPYLANFEVISSSTFSFILRRPWTPFLASLALPQASLVSPGAADQPHDFLKKHTLGSGQYKLYDWRNHTIGLMSRPELTTQPRVSYVMFNYEANPAKRYEKMLAHKAHLTIDPALPQDPGSLPHEFKVKNLPTYKVRYLAFNCERSFIRMQSVRRALAAIIKDSLKKPSGLLSGPFPAGLFYSNPANANIADYNPLEQSRYVLQEIQKPTEPLILAFKKSGSLLAEAEQIAKTLLSYGLKVELIPLEAKAGRKILSSGAYDLLLTEGKPVIPAPEMWLSPLMHSGSSARGNPAFFNNRKADELIDGISSLHMEEMGSPKEIVHFIEDQKAIKLNELVKLIELEAPYSFLYTAELTVVLSNAIADQDEQPNAIWPEVWNITASDLNPAAKKTPNNPIAKRPKIKREADDLSLYRPPTGAPLDGAMPVEKPKAPSINEPGINKAKFSTPQAPAKPSSKTPPPIDQSMLPPSAQSNYKPEFIEGVPSDND